MTVNFDLQTWCEILCMSQDDYLEALEGKIDLPLVALLRLAETFDVSLENIMLGKVDFKSVLERYRGNRAYLPERYSIGALSKRRTSRHLLEYIERFYGWDLKAQILRKMELDESVFWDPEAEININLIVDLCDYLGKRGISDEVIFQMGAYSLLTNQGTPLAKMLSGFAGPRELHEQIFANLIDRYWDKNHHYQLLNIDDDGCVLEAKPSELATDLLRNAKIGSQRGCIARGGTFSSLSGYIGLPFSKVLHTSCIHREDPACRDEIVFCPANDLKRPS